MADDILVDLMASASGITYAEALDGVIIREIDGAPIPFAGAELLYRMKKRTGREKDRVDIFSRTTLRRTGTPTTGGSEGATLLAGLDIRPVFPIAADCLLFVMIGSRDGPDWTVLALQETVRSQKR